MKLSLFLVIVKNTTLGRSMNHFLEKVDGGITPGNIVCFKHQPSQQRQVE
jgi:hypothetical protein